MVPVLMNTNDRNGRTSDILCDNVDCNKTLILSSQVIIFPDALCLPEMRFRSSEKNWAEVDPSFQRIWCLIWDRAAMIKQLNNETFRKFSTLLIIHFHFQYASFEVSY